MFLSPILKQQKKKDIKCFYLKDYERATFSDIRRSYEFFKSFPKESAYPLNSQTHLIIDLDYLSDNLEDFPIFSDSFLQKVRKHNVKYTSRLALYYIYILHRRKVFQNDFLEVLFRDLFL